VGIIDTVKAAIGDKDAKRKITDEEEKRRLDEQIKYYAKASDQYKHETDTITKSGVNTDVEAKLLKKTKEKYEARLNETPKFERSFAGKIAHKPTEEEKEEIRKKKDAEMERKIYEAQQEKKLRDAQPRPYNPPGRPRSQAKQGRGEFTAPSYKGGRGYGGGFDINMGNMMGGIAPQRGSHPDPFGGLRGETGMRKPSGPPPSFGDPFAGLGQRPKPKPAPVKKKKKSKDVVIRISRNPMIKGLGAVVGLPGGRKPRGRNPFEF